MTKAAEIDERLAQVRAAHDAARKAAIERRDLNEISLLDARENVAAAFPGCARAILHHDPALNWDRGVIVQAELARIKDLSGG